MKLKVLDSTYKVIKLDSNKEIPKEILNTKFYSITKTDEELSIIVANDLDIISDNIEKNFKIIKIEGILDFSLVGILSKISTILAENNISIFAISTYNTDYILVREKDLPKAIEALDNNGYRF